MIVGALLVGVLFSGCAGPSSSSAGGTNSLTRTIDVDIDPMDMMSFAPSGTPDQMLAKFAKSAFEYKHAGATISASDVTVRYQTTGGLEKTADLSKFVSKSTIAAGQTVRIAPSDMSIFSSMVLLEGDDPIASRTGLDKDWLTAAGVPLPIASSKTGMVIWDFEATAGLDVQVNDFSFDEQGMESHLETLEVAMTAKADAKVELQTTAGSNQKVTLRMPEFKESASVDMTLKGTMGSQRIDASGSIDAEVSLDGFVDLKFEDGALSAVGVQGDASVDVTFDVTGFPGPQPEDVHLSEDLPYNEEKIEASGFQDPTVVAFMERIWSLDLVVGDKFSFRMETDGSFGSPGFSIEYSSSVVGTDDKKVGSTTRPTLRVTDHFAFETDAEEAAELQALSYDFTYWIDQQSYLPVYQQGSISQTYGPDDFPALLSNLEAAMAGSGSTLPDDMSITIKSEATMQMTQYRGDFSEAAILTTGATRSVPLAAVVFVLVNNLGTGMEHAPSLGMSMDRSAPKLTVVTVEPGTTWDEYSVRASKSLRFDLNGAAGPTDPMLTASSSMMVDPAGALVRAADYLTFCGATATQSDVQVDLIHTPTNTMVYSATFPTIAKCV